jgi:hypothetical protein
VQIEAVQVKLKFEQQHEEEIRNQLIAAHNMSRVMRFFKGIRLQQLETNFAEVSYIGV